MTGHDPWFPHIAVRECRPTPLVEAVEAAYVDRFGSDPEDRGGWYHPDDWKRISLVLGILQGGGRVLDVGVGAGQFLNALAMSGRYESVTGVDPTRFRKYVELVPGIERCDHGVDELPFGDDEFDVVTCMEVLEHVDDGAFRPGISELRRVCRGQLVMTVPFEEPVPLSKTHRRRFVASDIAELFPDGSLCLLDRPRMPWMLVEEWPNLPGRAHAAPGARVVALEAEVQRLRSDYQHLARQLADVDPGRRRRDRAAAMITGVRSKLHGALSRAQRRIRRLRP